jgi:hypothetical protein
MLVGADVGVKIRNLPYTHVRQVWDEICNSALVRAIDMKQQIINICVLRNPKLEKELEIFNANIVVL